MLTLFTCIAPFLTTYNLIGCKKLSGDWVVDIKCMPVKETGLESLYLQLNNSWRHPSGDVCAGGGRGMSAFSTTIIFFNFCPLFFLGTLLTGMLEWPHCYEEFGPSAVFHT